MSTHNLCFYGDIWKLFLNYHYISTISVLNQHLKWAASWQNQQNGLCTQQRLRSAWASTQSDQSLLCAQWVAKDPTFLCEHSEDWSDWADAQADPSLRWAHMPFCWFCHEAAQMVIGKVVVLLKCLSSRNDRKEMIKTTIKYCHIKNVYKM